MLAHQLSALPDFTRFSSGALKIYAWLIGARLLTASKKRMTPRGTGTAGIVPRFALTDTGRGPRNNRALRRSPRR